MGIEEVTTRIVQAADYQDIITVGKNESLIDYGNHLTHQNVGDLAAGEMSDVEYVLISNEVVKKRIRVLARAIALEYSQEKYHGETLVLTTILIGAEKFGSELYRELTSGDNYQMLSKNGVIIETDRCRVNADYKGGKSGGRPKYEVEPRVDYNGKHLLIVEDIIDSGNTMRFLTDDFRERGAVSVNIAALMEKPSRREVSDLPLAYLGFVIPDKFVVGYGLDAGERYRGLPFIGVLREEVSNKILGIVR